VRCGRCRLEMNPTFTHFHKNRYEWAFRAKQEFINRFVRLEVQEESRTYSKELNISVYGPTQVGKTTLILTILGIKAEFLGLLSKWLRGQRKLGESSTVTVMRYERSEDSYFHIRLPNGETQTNLEGEQLESALQTLRSTVELGDYLSVEPVVVEIPAHFFKNSDVKLNIIDLPGVESAEQKEVEHVKQCIKHWLPLCELCLLVDDATQLTAFTQYTIKEIKNWSEQLEHFRVIPTRALSLDNIRKKIIKDEIRSAEALIGDYANVLNRVLKTNLNLTDTIYPIDVGNSWEGIQSKEPVLYSKMKGIMEEILLKLQKDLKNLNVNKLSFSRLTRLYKEAEEASQNELDELEKQIKRLDDVIVTQEELNKVQIKNENKSFYRAESEEESVRMFLKGLEKHAEKIDLDNANEIIANKLSYNMQSKRASTLNKCAAELQYEVDLKLEKLLKEIKKEGEELELFSCSYLELPYSVPISQVDQLTDLFLWFPGNFDRALSHLRVELEIWLRARFVWFNSIICSIRDEATELLNKRSKKLGILNDVIQTNILKLKNDLQSHIDQREQLKVSYQEIYALWEQDRQHANNLQQYFVKYWLLYKEELNNHFLYGSSSERWFASQYLNLLRQDGQLIIESLNKRGD
jgi:hypothetical protein